MRSTGARSARVAGGGRLRRDPGPPIAHLRRASLDGRPARNGGRRSAPCVPVNRLGRDEGPRRVLHRQEGHRDREFKHSALPVHRRAAPGGRRTGDGKLLPRGGSKAATGSLSCASSLRSGPPLGSGIAGATSQTGVPLTHTGTGVAVASLPLADYGSVRVTWSSLAGTPGKADSPSGASPRRPSTWRSGYSVRSSVGPRHRFSSHSSCSLSLPASGRPRLLPGSP